MNRRRMLFCSLALLATPARAFTPAELKLVSVAQQKRFENREGQVVFMLIEFLSDGVKANFRYNLGDEWGTGNCRVASETEMTCRIGETEGVIVSYDDDRLNFRYGDVEYHLPRWRPPDPMRT